MIILKFATFKNIIRKNKKADFVYKYLIIDFKVSFLTARAHSEWPDQMLNWKGWWFEPQGYQKIQNFFLIILKFATFKNIIRKNKKADFVYKYLKIDFKVSFLTARGHHIGLGPLKALFWAIF